MPNSFAEALARAGSEESAPATSSNWSSMRAAMRWTAPMNAPCPPPTMPSRMRRRAAASLLASIAISRTSCSRDAQHRAVRRAVGAGGVVEGLLRNADDVPLDEFSALPRAILGMLQRELPFEHRPARTIVLCELREHALKIGGKAFVRADQRATTLLFGRRRDEESLTYSEDDVSRRTENSQRH